MKVKTEQQVRAEEEDVSADFSPIMGATGGDAGAERPLYSARSGNKRSRGPAPHLTQTANSPPLL